MLYQLIRPILFCFDPERVHFFVLRLLKYWPWKLNKVAAKPRTVMGINFPNPVGLASGYDRNAECIEGLAKLGFGFIEVGTVTINAQKGNPKPRVFRLPEQQALINRYGFYNKGLKYFIAQLKKSKFKGVLGVSIVKNFETPIEDSVDDYLVCFRGVYPYASYVAVNISSPNTPGLRNIQFGSVLTELIEALKDEQQKLNEQYNKYVPLVIKIAPDINDDDLKFMAQTFIELKVDGVIATNTTVSREGIDSDEKGGLSGAPLFPQALHVVKKLHHYLQGQIPIIASGGIMSGEDAKKMMEAGASLVQIYTGLVYRGPVLIKEIIG